MLSRPKRILVIDDSEVVLSRMKRALMSNGFEVLTTSQIVGNARHLPSCDLVIIDYHMPGLKGSSVLESLKAVANSMKNTCGFILYTSDPTIAANYQTLGFDGVFSQKGDEDALVRQVRAFFRLAEIRATRPETSGPPPGSPPGPPEAPSEPPPPPRGIRRAS